MPLFYLQITSRKVIVLQAILLRNTLILKIKQVGLHSLKILEQVQTQIPSVFQHAQLQPMRWPREIAPPLKTRNVGQCDKSQ